MEDAAEYADPSIFFRIHQHFFATCTAAVDIDGGPDTFFDQFPIEHDFQVSSAFEFLKDHLIHFASGLDQGRGDDRQRAAFFDFACRAEESFGSLQGVGVQAARENLA